MAAIDWIKARTKVVTDEPLVIEGVTYEVETHLFQGHLPRPMIRSAARAELECTDETANGGGAVNEVIAVHAKSGFTEYSRTTYTPQNKAAA